MPVSKLTWRGMDREKEMQQFRLWEITAERKLSEIRARYAGLEQWIEDELRRCGGPAVHGRGTGT